MLSISASTLSTTVTGGSGSNLSLTLANFATIADLASYINAQSGYSASIPTTINGGLPVSVLDRVASQGIARSSSSVKPGKLKADSFLVFDYLRKYSSLVEAERDSFKGLPDALSQTFLSGGARGASSSAIS